MSPPRPVTPIGIAAALLETGSDVARATAIIGGLDEYVARCTTPASSDLVDLEQRTGELAWADGLEQEMLSGHVEGAFLAMLVAITGARRVLEIGMFTGYSALAMAEALPSDGHLVACEIDSHAAAVARTAFEGCRAGHLVEIRAGDALDSLHELAAEGAAFDLVFIDADKPRYGIYLDTVLDLGLLTDRGVVVADNTLMQGEPWLEGERTTNGDAIAAFNSRLVADPRVEQVLIPLRDGVTLIRRSR